MHSEDLESNLSSDHEVLVMNLENAALEHLTVGKFYIFVCSTYGDDDLPASAIDFGDMIKAEKPNLSVVKFSIFGLGDTDYKKTYNNDSQRLMALLFVCGAQVHGPWGLHDTSSMEPPDYSALPWVQARLTELS